jgi:hypothetical protein
VAAAAVNNDWLLNIVFQRKSLPVYNKQEDFFYLAGKPGRREEKINQDIPLIP